MPCMLFSAWQPCWTICLFCRSLYPVLLCCHHSSRTRLRRASNRLQPSSSSCSCIAHALAVCSMHWSGRVFVCCGKVDTLVRAHLICYWTLIWTFIFCLMPTDLYGWGWNSVVPGLYYDWEIRSWETRETLPNSAGDDKGQWLDVFTWEIGDTREF
jgi:hypothetical protein